MIRTGAQALSLLAAAALALGALPTSLQARTLMPSAGRAVLPGDYGCFALNGSTMTNICLGVKRLETSLPIDAGGTYKVVVNAQGATYLNNVGCQAVGVNTTATAFWGSGAFYLPTFGTPQDINLVTFVPASGGMFVACDVAKNGRVNTIRW